MLPNKSDNRGQAEGYQQKVPMVQNLNDDLGLLVERARVSESFPVSANNQSRNTGITRGQISGSNQTLTDVTAFGQMFGFGSTGHESCVSGWSWCCPSSYGSSLGFQAQGVLGIDSRDGAPIESCLFENVVDYHSRIRDTNAGVPKQQPGQISKPKIDPTLQEQDTSRFCCQGNEAKDGEGNSDNSHDSTRPGVQSGGIHPDSLTQNSCPEGALR